MIYENQRLEISTIRKVRLRGLNCGHYDMRFIKPLDESLLHTIFKTHSTLITIEDGVENGGFGSAILEFAATHRYKNDVVVKGIPDEFIEHGAIDNLQQLIGVSANELYKLIKSLKS